MAKQIKYLVIHCTDTPEGRTVSRKDIEQWHLKERGWSVVGYSDMIHLDGAIENLVPYDNDNWKEPWEITNGVRGFNSIAHHVVYVGGASPTKPKGVRRYPPKDTRTPAQRKALAEYVKEFVRVHPAVKVVGHNDLANKACPSFNVAEWCRSIGICYKNIGV